MAIAVGAYDSSGNFSYANMTDKLPDGAKWCTVDNTDYSTATTPNPITGYIITKSNDRFHIDQYGTVTIIDITSPS